MPVRLHEIPGFQSTRVDAAPMDPRAAAAPAAALGEIGQTFAGISTPFAKIAAPPYNDPDETMIVSLP